MYIFIMTYTYVLETLGNKNIEYNELDTDLLFVLCYQINNNCKYPFLQFMMEKVPFCNNLIEEQFVLPNVYVNKKTIVSEIVIEKVKNSLHSIGLDPSPLNEDMYKGIIISDRFKKTYAMVNISEIEICGIFLSRNSSCWFVLPTEIINTQSVCGIPVDKSLVSFFTQNPQVSILTNLATNTYYNLPDVVYTFGFRKEVEFSAIFGNSKSKAYDSCGEYYYFYRSFSDVEVLKKDVSLENGVNRFALFIEGELYIENEDSFSLTDEQIEHLYPDQEQSILICYSNSCKDPNLLVRKDTIFASLSFHTFPSFSAFRKG